MVAKVEEMLGCLELESSLDHPNQANQIFRALARGSPLHKHFEGHLNKVTAPPELHELAQGRNLVDVFSDMVKAVQDDALVLVTIGGALVQFLQDFVDAQGGVWNFNDNTDMLHVWSRAMLMIIVFEQQRDKADQAKSKGNLAWVRGMARIFRGKMY